MKKVKLIASLLSFCFAVAVLCFGVYAAQTVNYTVGGTLTYSAADDVFADMQVKVYRSKATNTLVVGDSVTSGTLTYIQTQLQGATSLNSENANYLPTKATALDLEEYSLTAGTGSGQNGDIEAHTVNNNGSINTTSSFSVNNLA